MPANAADWELVNQALADLMTTYLTGSNKRISVVSNWPNPEPASYPHAYPLPMFSTEDDYDTDNQKKILNFILRVEFPDAVDQASHLNALKTADALEDEIRKATHATLSGGVHKFNVSSRGTWGRTGEAPTALIVYDLEVSAEVLKKIT